MCRNNFPKSIHSLNRQGGKKKIPDWLLINHPFKRSKSKHEIMWLQKCAPPWTWLCSESTIQTQHTPPTISSAFAQPQIKFSCSRRFFMTFWGRAGGFLADAWRFCANPDCYLETRLRPPVLYLLLLWPKKLNLDFTGHSKNLSKTWGETYSWNNWSEGCVDFFSPSHLIRGAGFKARLCARLTEDKAPIKYQRVKVEGEVLLADLTKEVKIRSQFNTSCASH